MSDVYSMSRGDAKNNIDIFVTDDIGSGSYDRIADILNGFTGVKHAAEKAIGSAIKRAAMTGETYASRAVRNEYYVNHSDFKQYTRSKRHIITGPGSTTVEIDFRGFHIPLLKFDTRIGKDGRVVTRVMRKSARTVLDHAFTATMSKRGHTGIFERLTNKRLPVEEKLGPSTPQMMNNNDNVSQEIGDKIRETFEKRVEHEMLVIMNGWRRERA
jgi:hypothetical protein